MPDALRLRLSHGCATRSRRRSVVDRAGEPDYKPALPSRPRLGSAQVAQLVEHATENRSVGGSIPPLGTITNLIPASGRGLRSRKHRSAMATASKGTG